VIRAILLSALLLCAHAQVSADTGVYDDRKQRINATAPIQRIITLAPHAIEWLFEIGAGERVVGTVSFSDYPPAARTVPVIGNARHINLEKVIALQPDLAVAWGSGNSPDDIRRLESHGIPVYVSEPRTLEDIPQHLRSLGRLTGTSTQANATALAFEQKLNQLREQYRSLPARKTFIQIWPQPLMTVNSQHLISQALAVCNAHNVFADMELLAPTISTEAVLAARPEVIIAPTNHPGDLASWARFPDIPAVNGKRLIHVNPDFLSRPSSRILEGIAQVCGSLSVQN
jgi:iron complex transport system substrate-binding protein